MPNDMSGNFIAFDEASKVDWKQLMSIPMPKPDKYSPELFYFPKTGKIGKFSEAKPKYTEMVFTTEVGLAQVAPSSIDPNEIYKTMRQLMEIQQEALFRQRHEEQRVPTKKAYEILKTPDHWLQKSVSAMRDDIMAHCILGALMAKWGTRDMNMPDRGFAEDCHRVANYIRNEYRSYMHHDDKSAIAHWNDEPGRNFQEVQEILRLADV